MLFRVVASLPRGIASPGLARVDVLERFYLSPGLLFLFCVLFLFRFPAVRSFLLVASSDVHRLIFIQGRFVMQIVFWPKREK